MPILNYTTKVSPEKTVSEIQAQHLPRKTPHAGL